MRKNLNFFPGALPPDPCRSSIGALTRTSLTRFARRRPRIPRQGAAEQLSKVFLGAQVLLNVICDIYII